MIVTTYVINLAKRSDRRVHILKQFANRPEFNVKIVEAVENENGALGLWQTITHIIKDLALESDEYILICEDDHQFTKDYNQEKLFTTIVQSQKLDIDVLMGGVSWFKDGVQIRPDLFWIDKYSGNQFIIIFKNFFDKILSVNFKQGDAADKLIYELTKNKLLIYPFISTQKEFGYSDATSFNNRKGYVTHIFETSDMILSCMVKANNFYHRLK